MTVRDFFEKVRQQYRSAGGRQEFFIDTVLNRLWEDVTMEILNTNLSQETAQEMYIASLSVMQFMGMEFSHEEEPDPIWDSLTEIAGAFRAVMVQEYHLELPEPKIVSLVDEMIEDGILETERSPDGQTLVRPAPQLYNLRIKITKVPQGGAPEHVRKSWVGVVLPARKERPNAIHRRIGTGQLEVGRGGWIVPVKEALDALAEVDLNASRWFVENFGTSGAFTFGPDEAAVV